MSKFFAPLLTVTVDGLKTMANINSVTAHNLRPEPSAYGTLKSAVLKFTEFLLFEQAKEGLLAFSVHPGGVLTQLAEAMPKDTHAGRFLISCSFHELNFSLVTVGWKLNNCLGFTDKPEFAGNTVAFLTQRRREWLAGRHLCCTWDMEELLARKDENVQGNELKVRLVL